MRSGISDERAEESYTNIVKSIGRWRYSHAHTKGLLDNEKSDDNTLDDAIDPRLINPGKKEKERLIGTNEGSIVKGNTPG